MPALLVPQAPLARRSLAEAVYEQVLEAILTGSLTSGAELSEVTLAAELGVSRTPVHEAMRRLAADGLIRADGHRQARVAQFARRDVVEIYELRACLEPTAAARATEHMPAAELAALCAECDALAAAPESKAWPGRALNFDVRLHESIAAAAGNARLRTEIVKVRHLVRAFCRVSGSGQNLRQALAEHREILSAMQARDGESARRAMANHIASRLAAVLHELPLEPPE